MIVQCRLLNLRLKVYKAPSQYKMYVSIYKNIALFLLFEQKNSIFIRIKNQLRIVAGLLMNCDVYHLLFVLFD